MYIVLSCTSFFMTVIAVLHVHKIRMNKNRMQNHLIKHAGKTMCKCVNIYSYLNS